MMYAVVYLNYNDPSACDVCYYNGTEVFDNHAEALRAVITWSKSVRWDDTAYAVCVVEECMLTSKIFTRVEHVHETGATP